MRAAPHGAEFDVAPTIIGPPRPEASARFELLAADVEQELRDSLRALAGAPPSARPYLLVVRHGVTTTHQVRSAVDELRSIPSVGVVLNHFKSRLPKWLAQLLAS